MSKNVNKHSTRRLRRMATRALKRVWRYEHTYYRAEFPALWRDEYNKRLNRLEKIRTELERRGERV